jgi:hypothetical protein
MQSDTSSSFFLVTRTLLTKRNLFFGATQTQRLRQPRDKQTTGEPQQKEEMSARNLDAIASSMDDPTLIGTAVVNEHATAEQQLEQLRNQRRPNHEQTVLDEQGRRRFHGAFTGGFSAGYFNTVGSKDGWTPGQFKSSRDTEASGAGGGGGKKGSPQEGGGNKRRRARPEDFMDAEDLADAAVSGSTLTTTRGRFVRRERSAV